MMRFWLPIETLGRRPAATPSARGYPGTNHLSMHVPRACMEGTSTSGDGTATGSISRELRRFADSLGRATRLRRGDLVFDFFNDLVCDDRRRGGGRCPA